MNSLCGSMGALKNESSSCPKMQQDQQPSSPTESSSVSESTKKMNDQSMDQSSSGMAMSLAPPSLRFPSVRNQLDEDVEVQSPTSALLESLLSDQLDGDFMISSPVRTGLPENPTAYNHAAFNSSNSVSSFSPPRFSSLGFLGSGNKGKGMSPLHRVYNSPNNNNYMQMDQTSSLALPVIEDLLDEFQKDECGVAYSQCFDMPDTASVLLDGLQIGSSSSSSAFCGSMSEEPPSSRLSRLSQESNMYQMGCVTTNAAATASTGSVPLSQRLQQERHKEEEEQQQQQTLNSLTGPSTATSSEQVVQYSVLLI